jgi:hypothetical protein
MADNLTLKGTLGGMITVTLAIFQPGEIVKTVILATIGAVVSFFISKALKKLVDWIKRRKARDTTDE